MAECPFCGKDYKTIERMGVDPVLYHEIECAAHMMQQRAFDDGVIVSRPGWEMLCHALRSLREAAVELDQTKCFQAERALIATIKQAVK